MKSEEQSIALPLEALKAPFPWFGGKSRVAELVWDRFGNCPNYVEPFAGSLAVLLARPHEPKNETVNDKDAYLSNFWRALQADPEEVAYWADWPVSEPDLHARHAWLVAQTEFRERMLTDPEFYDARIAGWWAWGISQWIGSGWCSKPEWSGRANPSRTDRGIHRVSQRRVNMKRRGQGVQSKRALLLKGGAGVHRQKQQVPRLTGKQGVHREDEIWKPRPDLTHTNGIHSTQFADDPVDLFPLRIYMLDLAARLRRVRVCCGDWTRILGPSPTTKIGLTGVFLDPPYSVEDRSDCYSHESRDVAKDVARWALEHGDDPLLRIAVCGYAGEHEFPDSWECLAWKANGGYANQKAEATQGKENARRERIWFSPYCLAPGLFGLNG